ncbi:hypothetical protein SGPA1_70055 [Streptomyces misionensis JCM 4497]
MAGTPTFIWIAPTATRPLPRDPTTAERSVWTPMRSPEPDGLPKPPDPGGDAVALHGPPAKGAPPCRGWSAVKTDRVLLDPLAKAGFCEKEQLDELEPRAGANRDLSADLDSVRSGEGPREVTVDATPPSARAADGR